MRKRQCKDCDSGKVKNDSGEIRFSFPDEHRLPGFEGNMPITVHVVECTKCLRTWTYRKKRKG